MVDATRTYLADSLRERRGTPALRAGDWKIALDFYAYGMTGLLLENCRQRDLDRQELADQLFRLLSRRDGPPSGNLTDVPACQRA